MDNRHIPKEYIPQTRLGHWFDQRLPLARFIHQYVFNFLIPANLNYLYCFGAILLFMLISQIFSGMILAMHYVPHIAFAFESREYINRSVNLGWLFSSIHSVGASFFFMAIYVHIARGLYYGSYKKPRELAWLIGVILFFIIMLIAFTGYVASWSLSSTTAVRVITAFISKIPLVGSFLTPLVLGGYEIGQSSLSRLYAIHIILPFILCIGVALHIWSVHTTGQSNPCASNMNTEAAKEQEMLPFMPYGILKDMLAICAFALVFSLFVFYMPDVLQTPESFVKGDSEAISSVIAPEWYFVPFYSMLRAINFKIGFIGSTTSGVLTVIFALLVLFFVPWLDRSPIPSAYFRPLYRVAFWLFIVNIILLGYLGYQTATPIAILLSQISTAYYFLFFLVLMPSLPYVEKLKISNTTSSSASSLAKQFKLW